MTQVTEIVISSGSLTGVGSIQVVPGASSGWHQCGFKRRGKIKREGGGKGGHRGMKRETIDVRAPLPPPPPPNSIRYVTV